MFHPEFVFRCLIGDVWCPEIGGVRVSVTQEAINKIKAMIINGDLRPGARLPKESDLAEQLGLSRNSLREAVRALTLIRILETRQGDGTYVTSLEPSVLLETMTFVADFHQDGSLLHVFQVRRILESAATSLAAQLITDEELEALDELVAAMDSCVTVEAFVENDLAFHRTIALASRNPVLASLLESFSSRTSRARVWRGITQAGAIEQTKTDHRAIYDALRHHRPDLAGGLAIAHIGSVESWFEQTLSETESTESAVA
jgi:GntR family transcriptional repressor for pyruvate dehydrogenase complex